MLIIRTAEATHGPALGGGHGAVVSRCNCPDRYHARSVECATSVRKIHVVHAELDTTGAGDPGSHFLPQQPLHAVLFPYSARYSTMRRVPNPYHASIGGVRFLGTSGQPIDDILRQTEARAQVTRGVTGNRRADEDADADDDTPMTGTEFADGVAQDAETRLNVLENTLRWQHLAPTTPDTLGESPMQELRGLGPDGSCCC